MKQRAFVVLAGGCHAVTHHAPADQSSSRRMPKISANLRSSEFRDFCYSLRIDMHNEGFAPAQPSDQHFRSTSTPSGRRHPFPNGVCSDALP
jgi:hypothetical protein